MHVIRDMETLRAVGKIGPDTLVQADCLDAMTYLPDQSVDLVLADLPYG
jgi:DNA modification methylase